MKKNSALYTLGLVLIALTLLSFSVVIYKNNVHYSEDKFLSFVVMDRLYDLDSSIQESIKKIFELDSGISVSLSNNSASFYEALPNSKASAFNSAVDNFKIYVESNFSNIKLNLDNLKNNMPLEIKPYNVIYQHTLYNGGKDIIVNANENLKGIYVKLIIPKNVSCSDSVSSGSFSLTIDADGLETDCSVSKNINPSQQNWVAIASPPSEGSWKIYINFTNYNLLINASEQDAQLNTTLVFSDASSPYVEIPAGMIDIDFNYTSLNKKGSIRIA